MNATTRSHLNSGRSMEGQYNEISTEQSLNGTLHPIGNRILEIRAADGRIVMAIERKFHPTDNLR